MSSILRVSVGIMDNRNSQILALWMSTCVRRSAFRLINQMQSIRSLKQMFRLN